MSTDQLIKSLGRRVPASPAGAWPIITFEESITFHLNGDEIRVLHVDPAHTDGDSLVHFRKANVLHTGDLYFNGMYPFIDASAGGSIDGMVRAIDRALELCNKDTKVIPGHGRLSNMQELRTYRDMLKTVADRINTMMREGKSREEIIAAKPTQDLDEKWAGGFLQPDRWVGIVIDGLESR
jgi:glyoxylase-like metal-dependent hydrolase (beta-lactamase superfamily II)